jgi:NAD(P)-dependent dehydrogenase (short-subunit alcohol dehydrogenase family)
MTDIPNRIVVLTGATRGIGRALAHRLANLGRTVIGCGSSKSGVEKTSSSLGDPHRFDAVDVAERHEVEDWAQNVFAEMPPPDLLITNADVINRNAPLWEVSAKEFGEVLEINVDGTANVIRAFLSGFHTTEFAPYCASKWPVEGLTRTFAQELPSGLAAAAVSPGVVNTDILRSCWADSAAS